MIECNGINKCNLCDTVYEDEPDIMIFDEIGALELAPDSNLSISIRHTAITMFKVVVMLNIKRGAPRIGLSGACIHLASIHWNYPLTIAEISSKIGKKSSYITSELKTLRKMIEYFEPTIDIIITDEKYVHRYFLDISKAVGGLDDKHKLRIIKIINHMNDMDLLITYHANTRVCCIQYLVIKNHINLSDKEYCKVCHISRNTFLKFLEAFEKYKYILDNIC